MLLKTSKGAVSKMILHIAFGFLQLNVLYIVNYLLIGNKNISKKSVLFFVMLSFIASFLFSYLGVLGVFIPVIVLIVMNYLETSRLITSIVVTLSALIILVISDHVSLIIGMNLFKISAENLMKNFSYQSFNFIIFIILSVGLTMLCKLIAFQLREKLSLLAKYSLFITSLFVLTIGFIYLNIFNANKLGFTKETISFNTMIIFIYIIFIILILGLLMSTAIIDIKTKNKRAELTQLRRYSETLENMYDEVERFRHDYINILATMSEYIKDDDMVQLEKYFNEKIVPTGEAIKINNYKLATLKNLKNKEVKGTLVSKIIKAQDRGIDVAIEITETIEEIELDSIVLCRCLGVILDNAIEEAQKTSSGKMIVALVKKETALLIVVANTYSEDIPAIYQMYEKGYSTKGKNRGVGLYTLRDLISPYQHITLDTKLENGLFIQEIRISKARRNLSDRNIRL